MKIKVVVTEVWYIETEYYTAKELQSDENEYGSIGFDLKLDIGRMESRTIKYAKAKED